MILSAKGFASYSSGIRIYGPSKKLRQPILQGESNEVKPTTARKPRPIDVERPTASILPVRPPHESKNRSTPTPPNSAVFPPHAEELRFAYAKPRKANLFLRLYFHRTGIDVK
ncbi:MAG: hypothetical protein WD875_00950 [Pirellulales bacterium]